MATPGQRLGAILVDLVVILFISQAGAAPLALGSVALLFWLSTRKTGRDVLGKVFRIAVGCLGFFILIITTLVIIWIQYGDDILDALEEEVAGVQMEATSTPEGSERQEEGQGLGELFSIVRGFGGALNLDEAETEEAAQVILNEFVESAYDSGLSRSQIRELLVEVMPEDVSWSSEAGDMVEAAIQSLQGTPSEAVEGVPEAEPEETFSEVAVDSIDRLNRSLRLAQEDRDEAEAALARTREQLENERNRGFLNWLWNLIDDLGIGFGWGALYLTITHAWWRGTSIGKKIFRIRVVMIDKRPLNWWLSFERAGGYAAGFATGLLGFAQVFWDPNRQAIHDKVSETIVIQDNKGPVPGPWMDEGKAMWKDGGHGTAETP